MTRSQSGFTLVEVAIVLLVIGLLVGSILKGQEMISSARVRNLADHGAAIKAAYFGFLDRYDNVPGDWNATDASLAIGTSITGGGNTNGRLDNPPGAGVYDESNALWEQLSKSGFIQGAYLGTPNAEPNASNNLAPLNAFNNVIAIGRTSDYLGVSPVRLNLVYGRGVPVEVMLELDIKLDDGVPTTGVVRATGEDGDVSVFAGTNAWGGRESACIRSSDQRWDVAVDSQDCNAALLF